MRHSSLEHQVVNPEMRRVRIDLLNGSQRTFWKYELQGVHFAAQHLSQFLSAAPKQQVLGHRAWGRVPQLPPQDARIPDLRHRANLVLGAYFLERSLPCENVEDESQQPPMHIYNVEPLGEGFHRQAFTDLGLPAQSSECLVYVAAGQVVD